jgi:hypothetical protein
MSKTATATAVEVKPGVGRPKTKVTLKRVVLLNGKAVGRGRPSTEGKGERNVVFIPVDESYDVSKHGTGVKFGAGLKQFASPIKRMDIAKFKALTVTSA